MIKKTIKIKTSLTGRQRCIHKNKRQKIKNDGIWKDNKKNDGFEMKY